MRLLLSGMSIGKRVQGEQRPNVDQPRTLNTLRSIVKQPLGPRDPSLGHRPIAPQQQRVPGQPGSSETSPRRVTALPIQAIRLLARSQTRPTISHPSQSLRKTVVAGCRCLNGQRLLKCRPSLLITPCVKRRNPGLE